MAALPDITAQLEVIASRLDGVLGPSVLRAAIKEIKRLRVIEAEYMFAQILADQMVAEEREAASRFIYGDGKPLPRGIMEDQS